MQDPFDIEMQTSASSNEFGFDRVEAFDEKKHFSTPFHRLASYCYSVIHFQSLRDFQYGFQSASAFAFGSLLGYKSGFGATLAAPYLLAVTPAVVIFDTAGATIMFALSITMTFVLTCVFMYVVHVPLGMGYHNYTSVAIVFLCLCFIFGYYNTSVAMRKICLLLPVSFFMAIFTTPRDLIESDFAWQIMYMMLISLAIAVATSMFVFPRYACLEVQDRFAYSLKRSQKALTLAAKAMMSTHKAQAEVYLCEADSIVRLMSQNQEVMASRAVLSNYEPVYLLRMLFRRHQPAFNRHSPAELSTISLVMIWHIVSIIHASRNINFNEYHAIGSDLTRDSMIDVTRHFREVMWELTPIRKAGCSGTGTQNQNEINEEIHELNKLRDHLFSVIHKTIKFADMTTGVPSTAFASCDETDNDDKPPASDGHADAPYTIHRRGYTITGVTGRRATVEKDIRYEYDLDAKEGANRLAFSFFLFHLSELIHGVSGKFKTTPDEKDKKSPTTTTANSTTSENTESSAPQKSVIHSILYFPMCACQWLLNAVCSFLYSYVTFFKSLPVNWQTKTKAGVTTALTMGVALIFVMVPSVAKQFEQGQWIMFAMLFAQGDTLGGTLYQSRNRFLGTLMGAIYGYFVYISVGDNYSHIIAMYVPFIIIMGIIKQNQQWSYFGSIAQITGIIISFGRNPYQSPLVGDYSLLRIQQNAIGILLCLGCSFLTIPVFAIDLLKLNIVSVLDELAKSTTRVCEAYQKAINRRASFILKTASVVAHATTAATATSDATRIAAAAAPTADGSPDGAGHESVVATVVNKDNEMHILAFIQAEGTKVRAKLAQQPVLIEQSAMELLFFSKPFPEYNYQKLIACQRLVFRLITTIDRSLLRITLRFAKLKLAAKTLEFSQRVSGLVSELLGEVLGNMTRWSSQVRATVWDDPIESASNNSFLNRNISLKARKAALKVTRPESRAEHARGMERMHQVAMLLADNSVRFNNETMREWFDSLQHSAAADGEESGANDSNDGNIKPHTATKRRELTEAEIHQLFDILTTFNALFYASSHLATAAMDMGNLVFTILLLERKTHYKQF